MNKNEDEIQNYTDQNTEKILVPIYEKEANKLFQNVINDIHRKAQENEYERKKLLN